MNVQLDNPDIEAVRQLVWSNTAEASRHIDSLMNTNLSEAERRVLRIEHAHATLKLRQRLPDEYLTEDGLMEQEAEWLEQHGLQTYAGEAYYILGAWENWQGDNAFAMGHLKKAETLLEDGITKGMTYYKQGRISESEQLYEVAAHYYEEAVPYIEAAGIPLYAASVLREMGRMEKDREKQVDYFDRALSYVAQKEDTLLYLDILYAKTALVEPGSRQIVEISRYLCDSAGMKRHAYDIAKYYLQHKQMDSAMHYLDVLRQDTALLAWSKERYTVLHAQKEHLSGNDKVAYHEILGLYNQLSEEIEATGKTRTFAIAQRYDNEAERAKNLQLQLEKQHLYLVLAATIAAILMLLTIAIVVGARRRTKHLLEKAESEQKIEALNKELSIRRDALKRVLEQRVSLTKKLQESALHHKEKGALPEWAQQFVEQNIFSTGEQWQAFMEEFNGCYGSFLSQLKDEHPQLTAADQQVIALIVLGLDISDISLLLGVGQRTIWSRRLRIKTHLGLTNEHLDEWIASQCPSL